MGTGVHDYYDVVLRQLADWFGCCVSSRPKKPYINSINTILTSPFLTEHKPKALIKDSEVYLQPILFLLFYLFSSDFCSYFCSYLTSSPLKIGMKVSQSMISIYGFLWPEGVSVTLSQLGETKTILVQWKYPGSQYVVNAN